MTGSDDGDVDGGCGSGWVGAAAVVGVVGCCC